MISHRSCLAGLVLLLPFALVQQPHATAESINLGGGFWDVTPPDGEPIHTVMGGATVTVYPGATLRGDDDSPAIYFKPGDDSGPIVGTLLNRSRVEAGADGRAIYGGNHIEILNSGIITGDVVMTSIPSESTDAVFSYYGRYASAEFIGNVIPVEDGEHLVMLSGLGTITGDFGNETHRWKKLQLFGGRNDNELTVNGDGYFTGDAEIFSGALTWNGALRLDGNLVIKSGELTLNSDSPSTIGSVTVNGGTLSLSSANTIGSVVLNDGTLAVDDDHALGNGTLTIRGGVLRSLGPYYTELTSNVALEGNATIAGRIALAGNVDLGGAARMLTIEESGMSSLGVSAITNGSLIKEGGGNFSFSGGADLDSLIIREGRVDVRGENTIRELSLEQGVLWLNDRLTGNVTIHDETWLFGTLVGDLRARRGATFKGSSSQHDEFRISGDVVFEAGSVFVPDVWLMPDEAETTVIHHTQLNVDGRTTFEKGSQISVDYLSYVDSPFSDSVPVIVSEGGLTAPHSVLRGIESPYAAFRFVGSIEEGTTLMLTPVYTGFDDDQRIGDIGEAMDLDLSGGELLDALLTLNDTGMAAAKRRLSPQAHDAASAGTLDATRGFDQTLGNYLQANRAGAPGLARGQGGRENVSFAAAAAFAPEELANYLDGPERMLNEADDSGSRWGGFGILFGTAVDENATADRSGFTSIAAGTAAGLDYRVNEQWLIGWSFGYAHTDLDIAQAGGEGRVHSLRTGPYLSWTRNGWFVDGALTGGYHRNEMDRRVLVGGFDETAHAEYDAFDASVYLGGGYDLSLGPWTLTPRASLQYTYYDREGFTETGAGVANLAVDDMNSDSLRTRLGVTVSRRFEFGQRIFVPEASIGWIHQFEQDDEMTAQFASGTTPFTTRVGGADEDSLYLGTGISALLSERASGYLRYEGEFGDDATAHTLLGGVTVRF